MPLPWARGDALYLRYHDEEWGVPKTQDIEFFEKMVLEGFQSGLSWLTILRKREGFRKAFDGFDPVKVARYDERKSKSCSQTPELFAIAAKSKPQFPTPAPIFALRKAKRSLRSSGLS